eukprot:CAMPEP_0179888682 /NCGR_PEP_ID=MMETSP0982-20121206/32107_1 /TAXON_ID=483367 /ORGANISM="non described non described, Strain CCMP 2436" /LENGTH=156 /DNA_ID=CAMNT_0021784671 /DNA_START=1 /DNA_END=470 /DNA_ORIENTATION=+
MASLFGFVGANPTIDIRFDEAETRKRVPVTVGGKTTALYLFLAQDDVRGTVHVDPPRGKSRLEHMGIKIELIGRIEVASERSGKSEFTSLVRELEPPGELLGAAHFPVRILQRREAIRVLRRNQRAAAVRAPGDDCAALQLQRDARAGPARAGAAV